MTLNKCNSNFTATKPKKKLMKNLKTNNWTTTCPKLSEKWRKDWTNKKEKETETNKKNLNLYINTTLKEDKKKKERLKDVIKLPWEKPKSKNLGTLLLTGKLLNLWSIKKILLFKIIWLEPKRRKKKYKKKKIKDLKNYCSLEL